MTDPKKIRIHDYTYTLPQEKIAFHPLKERDSSRLLVFQNGTLSEDIYKNLAGHLPPGSLMIFNNTKVVEARILFQKKTGGVIEIFCLEPDERYADVPSAMLQKKEVFWKCLIGGASKWKHGQLLEKKIQTGQKEILLTAGYSRKEEDHFIIHLQWDDPEYSFAEIIHAAGIIPLPPYIKRSVEKEDRERYQTIYAHYDGSVAAPTAGLHFTPALFNALAERNIHTDYVTLHVGAGTFKPVKAETIEDHDMHAEFIHVSAVTIRNILGHLSRTICAVGTTSFRTVESLYWLGAKTLLDPAISPADLFLSQWEAYELEKENIPSGEALSSLARWMQVNHKEELITRTSLMAVPGYRVKIVNSLVTNFHQPQSTLLLLIAALIGEDWRKLYDYALDNNFRFLSYGDGNLIWVKNN